MDLVLDPLAVVSYDCGFDSGIFANRRGITGRAMHPYFDYFAFTYRYPFTGSGRAKRAR